MMKQTLAAAVFAGLVPMAASAVTTSGNISTTMPNDIAAAPFDFQADFDAGDAAGSYSFVLENNSNSDAVLALTTATVDQLSAFFRNGITFSYANGGSYSVSRGDFGGFGLFDTTIAPGGSDTLTVSFGEVVDRGRTPNGTSQFNFQIATDVAPVPVPASGLLLLGAFGGAAALRRRKTA